MHEQSRDRWLGFWARWVCTHPRKVLAVSVILAVIAAVWTAGNLRFQSNRNDLINPDLPWNQRFIDWQESFLAANQLLVVVDASDDPDLARQVVDELGPALRALPQVEHISWGFDAGQFSPRAIRLLPPVLFEQRLTDMRDARPLLEHANLSGMLQTVAQSAGDAGEAGEVDDVIARLARFRDMIDAMTEGLQTPLDKPLDLAAKVEGVNESQWQYLASSSGNLLFLVITPHFEDGALNPLSAALASIRQTVQRFDAQHPRIGMGLTGIEVIESDETDVATRDSTTSSIVAAALIAGLLIAAFHSFRVPLIIMGALLIGVAWSFGFLTLTIGHLQVLSVVFAVILLGLGVDFGLHLVSGFELVRHEHHAEAEGFEPAMVETYRAAGPGIITGAVTTAAAFGTTLFTDFTGVAEMGWIAAGGILLCLVAMLSTFPAMLRLVKPASRQLRTMEDRYVHLYDDRWIMPFVRRPRLTVVVALAVAIACGGVALWRMKFDYDLMKLQPRGVKSVELVRVVADQGGQSIYYGVSMAANLDEARALADAYKLEDTVSDEFGGIGVLFPPAESEKIQKLTALREDLRGPLDAALNRDGETGGGGDLVAQVSAMQVALKLTASDRQVTGPLRAAIDDTAAALKRFTDAAAALTGEQRAERTERLNMLYGVYRQGIAHRIAAALSDEPLTIDDLPPQLLDPYRDARGRMALLVFPQLPADATYRTPMDSRFLPRFVGDLLNVDPQATGNAVQFYLSGELIRKAYLHAGWAALLVVFLLVLVDFRNVADALLTLLPVAVGFALTFAVMLAANIHINAANIIVLPLMFGIGVDAGVHVLHRYRRSPHLDPPGLAAGTGKGITLTAMTTMIGFGSLMLASHRGIWSVGFVMTVGIGLTLAACWILLPAMLALRRRLAV